MCLSDKETINNQESGEVSQKNSANFLPADFKTVLGKIVCVLGKQHSDRPVLISYSSSKMQGNVLLNSELKDFASLLDKQNALLESGFFENDQGDEIDSFILPIDGIDLSPDLKGVIVDCDLRSFIKGFSWLLNPENVFAKSGNLVNALKSIRSFVAIMNHIQLKGCCMHKIDGHNFFFNPDYGLFNFVYDSPDIIQSVEAESDAGNDLFEYCISVVIMFLLTGRWPLNSSNDVLKHIETEDECVTWDTNANQISGNFDALNAWNALPDAIQTALYQSCFAEPRQNISFKQWDQILANAIDDVETCLFCGKDMFASLAICRYCGNSNNKAGWLTKWVIQNKNQPQYIKISFGRGTVLTGDVFGIHSNSRDFMRIMYNSKTNSLGLKNISNINWKVFTTDGRLNMVLPPDAIVVIEKDIEIEFQGYKEITMRFLGYETN
ncbi:hypothetical protein J6Y50_01770 [bacterium]|nr:hypothetical protein [bacterium]